MNIKENYIKIYSRMGTEELQKFHSRDKVLIRVIDELCLEYGLDNLNDSIYLVSVLANERLLNVRRLDRIKIVPGIEEFKDYYKDFDNIERLLEGPRKGEFVKLVLSGRMTSVKITFSQQAVIDSFLDCVDWHKFYANWHLLMKYPKPKAGVKPSEEVEGFRDFVIDMEDVLNHTLKRPKIASIIVSLHEVMEFDTRSKKDISNIISSYYREAREFMKRFD
jgi:hypothetical protein